MSREGENEGVWQKELVEKLATDALNERRRARRWGIFFKLLTFAYLVAIFYVFIPEDWSGKGMGKKEGHTAVVDLEGIIAAGKKASADNVVTGLREAFEDENTEGVVLRINTPGGSPVQSSYIYKEILRLREKYPDIPLYAVVTDMCASGGYFVAAAADRIYVNESSVIGSIGVLISGFGFVDAMEEFGVERRLMTAGKHKGILDPFSPMSDFDRTHASELLTGLHQTFITAVKDGRGDRLKGDNEELFSGLFWDGRDGIALGLADEIGSTSYVAREVVGAEETVDFTSKEDPVERLARRFGAAAGEAFARVTGVGTKLQLR